MRRVRQETRNIGAKRGNGLNGSALKREGRENSQSSAWGAGTRRSDAGMRKGHFLKDIHSKKTPGTQGWWADVEAAGMQKRREEESI